MTPTIGSTITIPGIGECEVLRVIGSWGHDRQRGEG
jgi:hypothetical protein